MSYEKQNWKNGDVITETKLNHMEDGIAGGGGGALVVTENYDGAAAYVLDKTWQDIYDAPFAVIVSSSEDDHDHKSIFFVINVEDKGQDGYAVTAISDVNGEVEYLTESKDGYPTNG